MDTAVEQPVAVEQPQESVTEASQSQDVGQPAQQETEAPQRERVNRYQKLANENRELKEWRRQKEQELARYSSPEFQKIQKLAAVLDERGDVRKKFFNELLDEPKSSEPPVDFDQYDEPTSKLLKTLWEKASKLDELEQWRQKQEQERQLSSKSDLERRMAQSDSYFDKKLVEKGILFKDKSGNITGDEAAAAVIGKATLAQLSEMMDDPRQATPEQIDDALETVLEGVSALERIKQKNQIKKPGVPSTGSKTGGIPGPVKGKETREQRIARMMSTYNI